MRWSYAIGADEWYSVDVTLDVLGVSYADILVFGSKGEPKAHGLADRDIRTLFSMILTDMDMYHVKYANILQFKAEFRKQVVDLERAENRMKPSRKVQP